MNPKVLLVIGGVLLVLILVSGLLAFSSQSKKKAAEAQQNQIAAQAAKIKAALSLTPTPTYFPPPNSHFKSVDGVNFLPSTINTFTVDKDNVMKTAQQVYPNLEGVPLMNKINSDIFAWLALNEFYQTADASKVSSSFKTNKIENMSVVTKDLLAMKTDYNPDVMKMDGYFLKLRYKGTLPGNLAKLKKTSDALQPLANQLISSYRDQIVKDPVPVLDNFNKNNTVLLMNNRETSRKFNSYTGYPPLVEDTDYDSIIKSLPVGKVSDIITLTTSLDGISPAEDYAYAVFYISQKSGTNLPVEALANKYVAKSAIQ